MKTGLLSVETPKKWLNYNLSVGDFVGENLLFNTVGASRFGRILAAG